MHWPAAFPCWSSAAPARWVWPPRWPLWWATAWAPRTASCSKPPLRWKKPARIQIVALDKTGTITSGEPRVTDILPAEGVTESELLTLAASLEQKSEHPLARAVLAQAESRDHRMPRTSPTLPALPGNGLTAKLDGMELFAAATRSFIAHQVRRCPRHCRLRPKPWPKQGKTPLFFGEDGQAAGRHRRGGRHQGGQPPGRSGAAEHGHPGGDADRRQRAHRQGHRRAGGRGSRSIAGVLPDGKEAVIRRLQESRARWPWWATASTTPRP